MCEKGRRDKEEGKPEARASELFEALVENAVVGVYISTLDGHILYANEAMRRMFGYDSVPELVEVGVEGLYRDPAQRMDLLRALTESGQVTGHEIEIVTKQGVVRRASVNAYLAGDRVAGMLLDVTEQRETEEALRESEERFRILFERLADAVFIVRYSGEILQANEAAAAQTGYSREELLRRNVMRDLAVDEPPLTYETIVESLRRGETVQFEERKRRKDGTLYWTECALSPVDILGESLVLSINRDVTGRKDAEERLQYLSAHDPLTGAYNRGYFDEELARLARGRRFPVSVVMVDVNGLKQINDREGHAAGDQVLRCAYEVLGAAVRAEDVVARIGGDEFAILLPETDEESALGVIARIRAHLAEHNRREGHRPVSMALGAATAAPHDRLEPAMRLADARMYEDKRERDDGSCRS